jgi:hypothetical protein
VEEHEQALRENPRAVCLAHGIAQRHLFEREHKAAARFDAHCMRGNFRMALLMKGTPEGTSV